LKSTSDMSGKKVQLLGLAILVLLAGVGCPHLPGVVAFISLQIDPTGAAKGLSIGDFEVTRLEIRVLDPEDEVLKTIAWRTRYGPQAYLLPVKETGEYEIEVTHFGYREDEAVQAFDSAVFDVPARQITVIDVVPGCAAVIRIQD
jgi:hypothetical protein